MKRSSWGIGIIALALSSSGNTAQVYADFPSEIHPTERYVFYSHGRIVEGADEKPVSPEFGEYDFPAIRRALFEGGGYNLIAYHRPKDIELGPSAALLEGWVRKLIAAGVKPSHITLVGFSRGGYITANAAASLRDVGVGTVVMATCANGDVPAEVPLTIRGALLSLYETTDEMGSCSKLAARSHPASFEEVAISTGRKHGAFFRPRAEWLEPLKAWIARTNQ